MVDIDMEKKRWQKDEKKVKQEQDEAIDEAVPIQPELEEIVDASKLSNDAVNAFLNGMDYFIFML